MPVLDVGEIVTSHLASSDGVQAVRALRDALSAAVLPLALPASAPVREDRARVLDQIDDYLLPRLTDPDRPLLIVVGGPTGVGKSTIVNTLVGERVSQSGMIRPTTRSPVLVHHPDDAAWFGRDGILPAFDRVATTTDDPTVLQTVPTVAVPRGVALLDAPDFDSIDDNNRRLANRLLTGADMWLFVTSANRYADEVPWEQLDVARQRDTPLMVVLNRIQPEDLEVVSTDLVRQLHRRGIGSGKVIVVEHSAIDDGMLRSNQVDPIRAALGELSAAVDIRRDIADQCVRGALREAARVTDRLINAVTHQVDAVGALLTVADEEYDAAQGALLAAATDGSVLRGELGSRWRDLVGTDEALATTELMQRLRERVTALPVERQVAEIGGFEVALDLALQALVIEHAERAATSASNALLATTYGKGLLDWSDDDLTRPSRLLGKKVRPAIAGWRRGLADGVSVGGNGDAVTPRLIGVALAVAATSTGAGVERGTPQAPSPVAHAMSGLSAMLTGLMSVERDRYLQPVLGWSLTPDAPARLRTARRDVDLFVSRATGRN